jgi:GTP-binding protein YchF
MSLQIGIVGLPNVGKSTLFNALTRAGAPVAPYPFTTLEPNVGIAAVPDERLDRLAALIKPEKVVPATVEFVDIAGLVKGASKGEGLGNQFLAHIRAVDAILMVVRAFTDPNVPHVTPIPNPLDDIDTVDTELLLADLATVERRIEKMAGAAKARPKDFASELDLLRRLADHLNQGRPARTFAADGEETIMKELSLLSAKPRLYVVNVGEDDLPDGGPWAQAVRERARGEGAATLVCCAACEAELSGWPPEDAADYRAALGLKESGLVSVIRASYELLGLITFFTITGGRVARAWTMVRGRSVYDAAGLIHTDMQRGFIRAEVIPVDRLLEAGGFTPARERGLVRLEGREYVVQDGDVVHIRFNV